MENINETIDHLNNHTIPLVSVIVPVFNDRHRVIQCIDALLSQDYPDDKYEIIVVDNNSTDDTYSVIQDYPIHLFKEVKEQSSYAARNKGLEKANGEIIAFTDSDCIPDKSWISNGVQAILEGEAELVGGKIQFFFKNRKDLYEVYDSLTSMQQETKINSRKEAVTANLFVKKQVFKKIGKFRADVKSGGDALFTRKAVESGFVITYNSNAIIKHPTRIKKQVLEKRIRIGTGQIPNWKNKGKGSIIIILNLLKGFLPPIELKYLLNTGIINTQNLILSVRLYFIHWQCNILTNYGRIKYIYNKLTKKLFRKA